MDRSALRIAWLVGLAWGMGVGDCARALAQQTDFPMTPPEVKRLIVENVHQFYVMRYNPPLEVPIQDQKSQPYRFQVPDLAARVLLAAQAEGQYERYIEGLSKTLRSQVEAKLRRTGRSPKDLVQDWQKRFMNRRIELTHHVKYDVYSIIRYKLTPLSKGGEVTQADLAFRFEAGKGWVQTDLTDDLIYKNWDFPGDVKRIPKQKVR